MEPIQLIIMKMPNYGNKNILLCINQYFSNKKLTFNSSEPFGIDLFLIHTKSDSGSDSG